MKTSALIYRPSSQATTWAGLSCAAAIFVAAICLGRTRMEASRPFSSWDDAAAAIDLIEAPPEPMAAPNEAEDESPEPETREDTFPEEDVEQRKTITKAKHPISRPAHHATSGRVGSIRTSGSTALYAPRPDYPYEARRQNATGSGLAILTIDQFGLVSGVRMEQSTGKSILDASALRAFARWRFKPGIPQVVRIPIVFNLTGASY
jgi:TonB family protein